MTTNDYLWGGGGVGWRRKSRKIQKRLRQVGRVGYNKVLSIATEPRFQRGRCQRLELKYLIIWTYSADRWTVTHTQTLHVRLQVLEYWLK